MREPSEADVDLLWAASTLPPDTDRIARLASRADVPNVLEAACSHRVGPLVLRALELAGMPVAGADASVGLVRMWDARSRLALPEAARRSLGPLVDAGLEPLALKGLSLVGRYPAPGLRPMDDIDVLVPAADVARARVVLRDAGWRQARHEGSPDPGYDLVFVHPDVPGVPLELHHEFTESRERPRALETRALWERRRPSSVFGQPAWILDPEIELVALVTHAAKGFHLFSRMLWIVDLAVVAQGPLNWDEVGRLATAARRRVATAVALRMARRLGASVPDELCALPRVLDGSGALETVLDPVRNFRPASRPHRLAYVLVDDVGGKLRYVTEDLLRPTMDRGRGSVVSDVAWLISHGVRRIVRQGAGPARAS